MNRVVKIGILKAGCIGSSPLIEFLLDERAERLDVDVKVIGSGSKLGIDQCREVAELMINQTIDFVIFIGPAQATIGPTEIRKNLRSSKLPVILISDGPTKKLIKKFEEEGLGYIILEADSMIGARREFLDPSEMAIYNSNVIKILAITGALNLIVEEIDRIVHSIKIGEELKLPRLIVDGEKAVEYAGFSNPYAKAKALASYEIAKQVSRINSIACFKIHDWKTYTLMVASAHEMMKIASKLAEEAREIEKSSDTLQRKPHFDEGTLGSKRILMEKPKRNN